VSIKGRNSIEFSTTMLGSGVVEESTQFEIVGSQWTIVGAGEMGAEGKK